MGIFEFIKKLKVKSEVKRSATYDRYLERIVNEIIELPEVLMYKAIFMQGLTNTMPEPWKMKNGESESYVWPMYFRRENLWSDQKLTENMQRVFDKAFERVNKFCRKRYAAVPEEALQEIVGYLGMVNEIEDEVLDRTHECNSIDDYIKNLSARWLYCGMSQSLQAKQASNMNQKGN